MLIDYCPPIQLVSGAFLVGGGVDSRVGYFFMFMFEIVKEQIGRV